MIQELRFFPSRTLSAYMAKAFLTRSVAVLAALVVVLQMLDLLGESGDILAVPGNGDGALWHYVGLRLPQIVSRFLPFSVLLGTLITFVGLNQNSEVIAMKAAGVSAHQILAPVVLASLGVAAVAFVFDERVVTRTTAALSAWQAVDYRQVPKAAEGGTNVWVREGDDIVRATRVSGRGLGVRLTGVTLYDRDGGRLDKIVTMPSAAPRMGADGRFAGWRAPGARLFDVAAGTVATVGRYDFGGAIQPDQFTLANVSADDRGLMTLGAQIDELHAAGRPTAELSTGWWHKISGPLSSLLMPLLAGVAAFGLARAGKLFIRAVIGMALGFAYFVADNFGVAMGNLGAYPPLLAAWAPFLLFLLIGEAVLIRTEE